MAPRKNSAASTRRAQNLPWREQRSEADRLRPWIAGKLFAGNARASSAHAVDRAVEVVGHQHRTVRHRQHVDGTADVGVVLDKAGDERLHGLYRAVAVELDRQDITADLDALVPRAMPGKEMAFWYSEPKPLPG